MTFPPECRHQRLKQIKLAVAHQGEAKQSQAIQRWILTGFLQVVAQHQGEAGLGLPRRRGHPQSALIAEMQALWKDHQWVAWVATHHPLDEGEPLGPRVSQLTAATQ